MREVKLTTYLRKANKEYEKMKRIIEEDNMKKWKLDYDYILFSLLRKEDRPFILTYKKKSYTIYTEEDLEKALLIINY
jgi:hypothetical protein